MEVLGVSLRIWYATLWFLLCLSLAVWESRFLKAEVEPVRSTAQGTRKTVAIDLALLCVVGIYLFLHDEELHSIFSFS